MANIKITVKYGQSLTDIAMQYYGSIEGLVQIASDNNISITEDLKPGDTLELKDELIIDRQVVTFYAKTETIIATKE